MSKQSDAKLAQGWQKKPDVCAGCEHFSFKREVVPGYFSWASPRNVDTDLRCTLGGFKTGKSNVCREFKAKEADRG